MSISSALNSLNTDIQNARASVVSKGGTVTVGGGSSQLATDIATIPSGGSAPSNFDLLHQGEFYYDSVTDKHLWKCPKECTVNGLEISGVDELYNGENSMAYIAFNASTTVDASARPMFQSRLINGDVIIKDIKLIATNITNTTIGAFCYGFCNTGITSLTFQDLETISVSVTLSSTTDNPLWHFIQGATSCATVRFPKLSTISLVAQSTGSRASLFSQAFYKGCAVTDMYFNSLTTTSFQGDKGTLAFNDMCTNAGTTYVRTLHFPSNMQSTISGLQGYPLFGGTSGYVVLAFDLTDTE